MPLRGRPRAARPSPRVDRTRLPATAALDGWPSPPGPQGPGATEPGVQADSSAACTAAGRLRNRAAGAPPGDPHHSAHVMSRSTGRRAGSPVASARRA